MKTYRRKCRAGYSHYWVRLNGEVTQVHNVPLNEGDGPLLQWDREILLECARCEVRVYIDSVIRTYLGVPSENDWGT